MNTINAASSANRDEEICSSAGRIRHGVKLLLVSGMGSLVRVSLAFIAPPTRRPGHGFRDALLNGLIDSSSLAALVKLLRKISNQLAGMG